METKDTVLVDISTSKLTLGEVMARIAEFKSNPAYADYEVFLDADRNAIIARLRY